MSGCVEKGNAPRLHHARLANTSRARQKARVKDGRTTKSESSFGKKFWCVLIVVILGGIGWQMWKLHAYNNAVREAKAAGFTWTSFDPLTLIRQDWRNALEKETWSTPEYRLDLVKVPDLARHHDLIHRLRPTQLFADSCMNENLDALKGLTCLKTLTIYDCPALQNFDALKGLTSVESLFLSGCSALQNVDGLQGLDSLKELFLGDCLILQNVDALKGLTNLQELNLANCPALENVDVLKALTSLKNLDFSPSPPGTLVPDTAKRTKISEATKRELRAALPKTEITFPDGTVSTPQ